MNSTFLPLFYMNTIFPTKYIYNSFPAITGPAWYILVFLILLIILFLVISVISGIMEIGRSGSRQVNLFGTDRSLTGAAADFITANGIIAKIAFLLMVLVLFVIVLRLSIAFMAWLFSPSHSPHLIDGMIDAKQTRVFEQDPKSANYAQIVRSSNGLGFTWSVWIHVDDYNYLQSQYKHVFSKGNSDLDKQGLVTPNNAPGVYLTPNDNNLLVIVNTFEEANEHILIPNIPLNKWVNVIIRCDGNMVDVYINGTIAQTMKTKGVVKQNFGDVFVSLNGGFSGNTSNLWYYNYPLGSAEIQALFNWGPNTNMAAEDKRKAQYNDYLSLRWFFGGVGDQFNPYDSGNLVSHYKQYSVAGGSGAGSTNFLALAR